MIIIRTWYYRMKTLFGRGHDSYFVSLFKTNSNKKWLVFAYWLKWHHHVTIAGFIIYSALKLWNLLILAEVFALLQILYLKWNCINTFMSYIQIQPIQSHIKYNRYEQFLLFRVEAPGLCLKLPFHWQCFIRACVYVCVCLCGVSACSQKACPSLCQIQGKNMLLKKKQFPEQVSSWQQRNQQNQR